MTVRKAKSIFDTNTPKSHDVIYTYKVHRQSKNKANSYLSVSLLALFVAVVFVLISYMAIDFDDSFAYDSKPMVNIILTPQEPLD